MVGNDDARFVGDMLGANDLDPDAQQIALKETKGVPPTFDQPEP